jgi:hypothetical protein
MVESPKSGGKPVLQGGQSLYELEFGVKERLFIAA